MQYGLNNEVCDFNHDFTVHYSIYNSELRDFASQSNEWHIRLFSRSVTVPGCLASQSFQFHKSGGSTLDPSMSWQCFWVWGSHEEGDVGLAFDTLRAGLKVLSAPSDGISGIIEHFVFHSQKMSGLVSLPSVGDRTIRYPACHTPKERQHLFFWQNCEPPRWITS